MTTRSTLRMMTISALATAGCLIGGLMVGGLIGNLLNGALPGHLADEAKAGIAAIPALAAVLGGGALWGDSMRRVMGAGERRRMAWAGALGYGPTVTLVGLALTGLEVVLVERGGANGLPIHVVFSLLFTPAAFLIAASGGFALGLALRGWSPTRSGMAGRLALGGGLAAGLAFLAIDLLLDTAGWRVGAPGAAERATMLTVALTGNLAAALAGGAAIGYWIQKVNLRHA
ncbi:MAG: hypothetical protein HY259_12950 [Chloroflexi bacterium]|nr:hypothetical protein [Chloroflexota bacterium]MBI3734344.1 hypothetical protein [Chloroflexota bacterium]